MSKAVETKRSKHAQDRKNSGFYPFFLFPFLSIFFLDQKGDLKPCLRRDLKYDEKDTQRIIADLRIYWCFSVPEYLNIVLPS